ncbi:unnamed protein product [Amoebophrya sp. A120]|nr:unnamed protein product [Amoebophrya sp. A120]|eukprot:GSA120T00008713001.1
MTSPKNSTRKSTTTKWVQEINWSMLATWVTLFTTVLFNLQFQFIYRNMQQGPLFNTLLTEYSDPVILDALDLLEDFQKASAGAVAKGAGVGLGGSGLSEKGANSFGTENWQYAYDFLELQYINHPRGREIDHARRRLISWYSKVRLFFEFDLLSSSYLGVIPGERRTQFFLSIVEPLDTLSRAIDLRPPNPVFEFFREQYNLPKRDIELDWTRVPASLQFKKQEHDAKRRSSKARGAEQEGGKGKENLVSPAGGPAGAASGKSTRVASDVNEDAGNLEKDPVRSTVDGASWAPAGARPVDVEPDQQGRGEGSSGAHAEL